MNKLNHIAFIMDGNGRWGIKNRKNRNYGHLKGVETVKKIVKASVDLKIPIVTFFVFSSENWNRPRSEINFLFKLIENYFLKEINNLMKQKIKINILGETKKLKKNLKSLFNKIKNLTKKNDKILVNLAINYGSKIEIMNSLKKTKKKINLQNIERNLYTNKIPDPDILIRTGGHKRLSNFMLWQLAYAELFFLDKMWPDFSRKDLKNIIRKFKYIKRNFGRI